MKFWSGVVTEKLKESKEFYTRLFGCEVVYDSDWFVLLQLGPSELGFMQPGLETQAPIFRSAFSGEGFGLPLMSRMWMLNINALGTWELS